MAEKKSLTRKKKNENFTKLDGYNGAVNVLET